MKESAAAKKTVLIVDDEEDLRMAIGFDFRRKGFEVLEAENGRLALDIVKSAHIDIVLSDVRMPVCDGSLFLEMLKEYNAERPILFFITGYSDMSPEQAFHLGADAIFAKPYNRQKLYETVMTRLIDRAERWRSTENGAGATLINLNAMNTGGEVNLAGDISALGRGGFFVDLSENFPPVGARVAFTLNYESVSPVTGYGVIRWVRAQSSPERPAGCGVEIESLSDACRLSIVELIGRLQLRPFIPRE